MAEPTSAYSFEDLIKRVAREAGLAYYGPNGQGVLTVPLDVHDLDLCKRIINDAIKMFIANAPRKGWRWMRRTVALTMTPTRITGTADSASTTTLVDATLSDTYDSDDDLNGYWIYVTSGTGDGSYAQVTDYTASTGTVTVADWLDAYGNAGGTDPVAADTFAITPVETVEGEIHRYPLPENFGGEVSGEIQYASSTNHASAISWVDESLIRTRRSVAVATGYPIYAATRPMEPRAGGIGPKRRWEIMFDPKPVATDTVEFPYPVYFDSLDLLSGDADSASTTTLVDGTIANLYPDDYFNGWKIKIVSGTGRFSYALVSDYTGATGAFTVADWLWNTGAAGGTDPGASSIYVVHPLNSFHPAGMRYDECVLDACLARAEMEIEDIQGGFVEKYLKMSLPAAIKIDERGAPRTLGSMNRAERHTYGRMFIDREYYS